MSADVGFYDIRTDKVEPITQAQLDAMIKLMADQQAEIRRLKEILRERSVVSS